MVMNFLTLKPVERSAAFEIEEKERSFEGHIVIRSKKTVTVTVEF